MVAAQSHSAQGRVHFINAIILMGVRWYVVYPLSDRHVEELAARALSPA